MQRFEIPEMEIKVFDMESIVTASSGEVDTPATQPPGGDNETGIY